MDRTGDCRRKRNLRVEMAFFSKASYFVILVWFRKALAQSKNFQFKLHPVRISLGQAKRYRAGLPLGLLSFFNARPLAATEVVRRMEKAVSVG
jgi:hypothetical protein